MDGIKKIKPIKKNIIAQQILDRLSTLKEEIGQTKSVGYWTKLIGALVLVSLLPILFPQKSMAADTEVDLINPLVFEVGDHTEFMREMEMNAEKISLKERHDKAVDKLQKQLRINEALKGYLQSKHSPLAEYATTILEQNNWKKIIALSNAESTMCRRYIEQLSNCWGVGGTDLWDMGDNLGEGVRAMNDFLNTAPKKSPVKYSQMNFEQMNGLYKQPPRDHWVYNNLEIYNELTALEKSLK
ncbi:MAG: hypothetical protein KW793_00290 [Candidatus Doudnabacteria bacterium]|nr:hypothetical protein [Candidatus Doudnabacteria bacterium]